MLPLAGEGKIEALLVPDVSTPDGLRWAERLSGTYDHEGLYDACSDGVPWAPPSAC